MRLLIYGYAPKEFGGEISGGVATYIGYLLKNLKGFKIGLLAENVRFFKREYGNVFVYGPPSKRWFFREILYTKTFKPNSKWLWNSRLKIIIDDLKPEIFYSHIPHSPANRMEVLKGLRFIVEFPSIHAYMFERNADLKKRFYDNMLYSYKNALWVVFPSSKVEKQVKELFGDRDKTFVIPPVVKVPNWNYTKEESRKVLSLEGDLIVGFAGMLTGRKGEDLLIKASVNKPWKLVIAGGGSGFNDAVKLARDLNINAVFLGDISGDKLWHFYNSLDVFCLPSRSETFGIAVVEAMLFGKNVVVSKEIPEEVAPEGLTIRVDLDVESVAYGIEKALNSNIKGDDIRNYALRFSDEEAFISKHLEVFRNS